MKKTIVLLFTCLALVFTSMAPIHAVVESYTTYELDSKHEGTIDKGKSDYLQFYLSKPAKVYIDFESSSGAFSFSIKDANNNELGLATSDYDATTKLNFFYGEISLPAGTYYMTVMSDAAIHYVTELSPSYYETTFTTPSSLENPHPISLGKKISGAVFPLDPYQCYSFTTPVSGNYYISGYYGFRATFYVCKPNGDIEGTDTVYFDESLHYIPLEAGKKYVFIVEGNDEYEEGNYNFTIWLPATSVKLNYTSKSIYTEQKLKLNATVSPSQATYRTMKWTSSNTKVATVDSYGNVTGKSTGVATIKATSPEGKSASTKITVLKRGITKTSASVYLYNKTKLYFGGSYGSVTWKSSNTSIATVDKYGNVTTRKVGTAYITAVSGKVTSKTKISVLRPTISATSKSLHEGTGTTLKVNGGSGKITWSSSNKKVATVSSKGYVSAKKPGTAYIYVKRNGYTTKCKVSVKQNAYYTNKSLSLKNYSTSNAAIVIKKVYYNSSRQLVASAYVVNNTPKKIYKLNKLGIRIATKSGNKTIASQTFTNLKISVNKRSTKAFTITFSKSATKNKYAQLYNGVKDSISGTYSYYY